DPGWAGGCCLPDGERRRKARSVWRKRDVLVVDRVAPLRANFLGNRRTQLQSRAIGGAAIGLVAVGIVLTAKQFDSGRDLGAEKIGFGRGQVDPPCILSVGEGGLDVLARAVEIAIADL